jgi:hypothetical protein
MCLEMDAVENDSELTEILIKYSFSQHLSFCVVRNPGEFTCFFTNNAP